MTKLPHDAVQFAQHAHEGQFRKDGQTPVISHPLAVATYLHDLNVKTPVILRAAILHDTIEDCDVTWEDLVHEFGHEVANIVRELSLAPKDANGKRPKGCSKRDYENGFYRASEEARIIKLSDRAHNMTTMKDVDPNYAPKYAIGTLRLVASCLEKGFSSHLKVPAHVLAAELIEAACDYLGLEVDNISTTWVS